MAVQRHPVDSFNPQTNFWEEFPDYKLLGIFGALWKINRKHGKLKNSSNFMWALTLCYDRKSSFFPQPVQDKWEGVSEQLFDDMHYFINLALMEEPHKEEDYDDPEVKVILLEDLHTYISEFEQSIDTPLGMALRRLEKKLVERTKFIEETPYTLDHYEVTKAGKNVLRKGTADQLDRMFRDSGKINEQVQKALDDLKSSEGQGSVKGGGIESLGDGDKTF